MAGGVRSVANTIPVVKNFLVQRQPTSTYALSLSGTTYVFTGTAATLNVGIAPASGSYSFTGTGAVLGIGIAPSGGSYTYTGTAATLGVAIAPAGGLYAVTGTGPTLGVGLVAAGGVYSFTGTAASLNLGHTLSASSGAYSIIGAAVAFVAKIANRGFITHFYGSPYVTEDRMAGYVQSGTKGTSQEVYYRKSP